MMYCYLIDVFSNQQSFIAIKHALLLEANSFIGNSLVRAFAFLKIKLTLSASPGGGSCRFHLMMPRTIVLFCLMLCPIALLYFNVSTNQIALF